MCGATVSDAAALADFGTLVQRLWRHWPATSAKAVRFRSYLGVMYWHALSLLAHGGLLADLYFQRCLGVLHAAWTGIDPEQELIDRLHQAVQADPEVTDVA